MASPRASATLITDLILDTSFGKLYELCRQSTDAGRVDLFASPSPEAIETTRRDLGIPIPGDLFFSLASAVQSDGVGKSPELVLGHLSMVNQW